MVFDWEDLYWTKMAKQIIVKFTFLIWAHQNKLSVGICFNATVGWFLARWLKIAILAIFGYCTMRHEYIQVGYPWKEL